MLANGEEAFNRSISCGPSAGTYVVYCGSSPLPIDQLVELEEIELPALAALEHVSPPMILLDAGLDDLEAVLEGLRELTLPHAPHALRRLHHACLVCQSDAPIGAHSAS
jgi:hypothetical protein